ncbi:hypothetical protein GCM10010124_32690 [Pilimelia terevasa]|uniref:Uncharacterized protein n=1 Tax=Pilimelia terevasa TaxID=53372 RepID=A0A8J3BTA2_9ACTN|nr:hypothetical protein [Pilimelia terevasa]GGK37389.1 hypothetical protein GCM10010124_32690 [Pilimelia terevasa]
MGERRVARIGGRILPSYRFDLISALLGLWMFVGLLLDAWAHSIYGVESFFTAWHAVLYTGFLATSAWLGWAVLQPMLAGARGLQAVPYGYALAVAGLVLFGVCAVADLVWHEIFGIENGFDVLFSPSHLGLITGGVLIGTGPVRSRWGRGVGRGLRVEFPLLLGLTLSVMPVFMFLEYGDALVWDPRAVVEVLSVRPDFGPNTRGTSAFSAAVVITTLMLLGPLLMLSRRGPVPPGAAVGVYATATLVQVSVTGAAFPHVKIATVVAGVLVEVLLYWCRPTYLRPHATVGFAAAAALGTWVVVFAAMYVPERFPRVPEYWAGLPFIAVAVAVLLALLVTAPSPPRRR